MKDIDFLPSRYSEQQALRKSKLWHLAVVCLFGLAVCAAAASQYAVRRGLKRQVATASAGRAAAVTKFAQLAQLRTDLDAARDDARLYNYLQHPWPRTQMLAEIVRPLPESLALTELSIAEDHTAPKTPPSPPPANPDAQQQLTPARRDLEHFRQRQDHRRTIITLTGITRDSGALHSYVSQLGRSPLFVAAELESLESLSGEESLPASAASFLVRVVVVPGYGQPGGPRLKPPTAALAKDPAQSDQT